MSYLALYRKYRPNNFDSVYGQEEIVTVIKNAILNNKLSHAYLFCGPRGTGKTTIAKIIGRLVNCEHLVDGNACGKCYNCINFLNSNDIVEIDAASNNGVDEIRELRDKINLVPSNSKFKVYIIDEVHMLTTQAFNALLKTLEEPPSHVIFILATTEPHKIPLTIASRCQKFRFSKISDENIVDRLREICKFENIVIDDDALYEIARLSDGGMRDAINFLDQLIAYCNKNITIEDVYMVNGSVSYDNIYFFLRNLISNDKIKIIKFVEELNMSGKDINKFIEELIIFLKDVIVFINTNSLSSIENKNSNIKLVSELCDSNVLYNLIDLLNEVQNVMKLSSHGYIIFMTYLLKFSDKYFLKNDLINDNDLKKNIDTNVCNNKNDFYKNISQEINFNNNSNNISEEELKIRVNNALALASKDTLKLLKDKWNLIDNYLFDDEFSVVSGILRDSNIAVGSSKYVILTNDFESNVSRINENIEIIEKLFEKVFGYSLLVVAITVDEWKKEKEQYILNLKKGNKYVLKNLPTKNNDCINRTAVDDLIDLVGENVIEYK